jgi:autotransporter-associated beta strand protein
MGSTDAAVRNWTGAGGTDAGWSNSGNWSGGVLPVDGDDLVFNNVLLNLNNTNNLLSFVNSITFQGPNYKLWGNPLIVTNGLASQQSSGSNFVELNLTLGAPQTFSCLNPAAGQIFDGAIDNGGFLLTFGGSGSFAANATITGAGGVTKIGIGTLTFATAGDNTYGGFTRVNGGTLLLNIGGISAVGPVLIIGDGFGTNSPTVRWLQSSEVGDSTIITNNLNGLMDLNGNFDVVASITLTGSQITTGAGTLLTGGDIVVASSTATSTISGNISFYGGLSAIIVDDGPAAHDINIPANMGDSGSGLVIVGGPTWGGWLSLQGSNSFTGPLTIARMTVSAESPHALGTTNGSTVVQDSGVLFLPHISFTNYPLTLVTNGTLEAQSNCIWNGPITLTGDATIKNFTNTGLFDIQGRITGSGNLTMIAAAGSTNRFSGTNFNNYVGTTILQSGYCEFGRTAVDGSTIGDLQIGGPGSSATLRYLVDNQISSNSSVTIFTNCVLDLNSHKEGIDALNGTGTISLGTLGTLAVGQNNGSGTFNGSISGSATAAGWQLAKYGNGTFTLSGTNTYTGDSHIFGGTMAINGYQPQSRVYVEAGATLGGAGTVGEIYSPGTVSPGSSPGILTCSNLTFTSSGAYVAQLSGRVAGANYDQINVRGTNNLANATLTPVFSFTNPVAPGDQLVIINNDGVDAVTGIFSGWPEGTSVVTPTGYKLAITYLGGTSNDTAFVVQQIPGGLVSSAVAAGNGNHSVDPNDCNNLAFAITNTTGATMTNLTAVLSTTTVGAAVTQPYSTFPDIPAGGKATNFAPFQLTAYPGMICGTNINLQLSIFSASHGAFILPITLLSGEQAIISNRFDVSLSTNIPDVGAIESTNTVSGFVGPLSKVVVSLRLTHPADSNLTITLIAPNGSGITLCGGIGVGANFGSACSPDSSRTTFDDSAAVSITAGSPPFLGSYRPQFALSSLLGSPANGRWRLRVQDSTAGTIGTLQCWSLALYGVTCATGSGACGPCLPMVTAIINTNNLAQTNRLLADRVVASCASPKPYPGVGATGSFNYNMYAYTNTTGAAACASVAVTAGACNVQAAAYLDSFVPSNIAANYLGDSGYSTGTAPGGTLSFSVNVPAGHTMIVVVAESAAGTGCASGYTLAVTGLPCPAPALNVQALPPNQARLFWTNSAGGYLLESSPAMAPNTWTGVGNEPLVSGGYYNVTNPTPGASKFFRLHKP